MSVKWGPSQSGNDGGKRSKAVVTYIFGDYDVLKDPKVVTPGWDYLCVSDKGYGSEIWQPVAPDESILNVKDPKRKSSLVKIAHYRHVRHSYLTVMTVDASMRINCNLDDFLSEYRPMGCDLLVGDNPYFKCIYDEADFVIKKNFDHPDVVRRQVARYKAVGFPARQGVYVGAIMVKSDTSKRLRNVCDIWAEEYMVGSRRDQLSLRYSIWLHSKLRFRGLRVSTFDLKEVLRVRKLFEVTPHNGTRVLD